MQVNKDILFYAFRYSLGRMTFAPVEVMEAIIHNINKISDGDLRKYIEEIKECKDYGMESDRQDWLSFVKYLERELENRL